MGYGAAFGSKYIVVDPEFNSVSQDKRPNWLRQLQLARVVDSDLSCRNLGFIHFMRLQGKSGQWDVGGNMHSGSLLSHSHLKTRPDFLRYELQAGILGKALDMRQCPKDGGDGVLSTIKHIPYV
eukprot:1158603-Pelagomonas_calceolata.AAC.1